jgi:aspartokinase-like uncharacterized kinase
MTRSGRRPAVDAVIKVGGALLRMPGALETGSRAIALAARSHTLLVVPGGGVFADAVREVERESQRTGAPLSSDAAHWMAILGMDQYAQVLGERIHGADVVDGAEAVQRTLDAARIPVLAPYRWLRAVDPLPHSWDVTSDSIAAWVAGAVGARAVVLVKPVAGAVGELTDAYFTRALPEGVCAVALAAGVVGELEAVLARCESGAT